MDNQHTGWNQGYFVNKQEYNFWTHEDKRRAQIDEQYRVRPSPEGNAVCTAVSPQAAIWIAQRLNAAALAEQKLEQIRKLFERGYLPEEVLFILGPNTKKEEK